MTPDSGAAASLGALPRLGDGASLPWKEALKEGQRRPFAPLEVGKKGGLYGDGPFLHLSNENKQPV